MDKIRGIQYRRELTEFRKILRKSGSKGHIYEVKVKNFLVKFQTGPNAGRQFIIENVRNEAEAINQAFERVKENFCPCLGRDASLTEHDCCFTQVEVQQLPLGQKR